MTVKQIMTKDVGGLIPESSIIEAAHKMESLGVGFLPICNGEKLVGVITDRDIVVRAVAKGINPGHPVKDYMTAKVDWVYEDEDISDAASLMKRKKIRRLVVLNKDKQLSGVVSLGDIAVYSDNGGYACKTLKEVSAPAQPKRGS